MSLTERLAKVGSKVTVEVNAKRDARRAAWERIQKKAPEIAESMLAIKEVFGKPEAVAVWIDEERVL
jgi:hypothetical protein